MKDVYELARENFRTWNTALRSGDKKKAAALYADDASFLPTMLGGIQEGRAATEDYFEHFLLKNPDGVIVDDRVHEFGKDSYLHSGLYTFEVNDGNGGREKVAARFSYVWKQDSADGTWRIIHHHSSLEPQT